MEQSRLALDNLLVTLFAIAFDQLIKLLERPIITSTAGFHVLDMARVQIVLSIDQTRLPKGLYRDWLRADEVRSLIVYPNAHISFICLYVAQISV